MPISAISSGSRQRYCGLVYKVQAGAVSVAEGSFCSREEGERMSEYCSQNFDLVELQMT